MEYPNKMAHHQNSHRTLVLCCFAMMLFLVLHEGWQEPIQIKGLSEAQQNEATTIATASAGGKGETGFDLPNRRRETLQAALDVSRKPQTVAASSLPDSWRPRPESSKQLQSFLERNDKEVVGWFFPGAMYMTLTLMRLQLQAGVDGAVGEIGVHHGKLTSFLAFFARQHDYSHKQLFAADLFEGMQEKNIDNSGSGNTAKFYEALTMAGTRKEDFVIFVGPSQDLSKQYFVQQSLAPFRFFSVDGGHTKETALSDLLLIEKHIADGGIVALDDFLRTDWWGVTEAALEYEKVGTGLVPLALIDNKLFYTTPSHFDHYKTILHQDQTLAKILNTGSQWRGRSWAMDWDTIFQAGVLLNVVMDGPDWYGVGKLTASDVQTAAKALLEYFG